MWRLRRVTRTNIYRAPDSLPYLHVICLFVDTLWRVELFTLYTSNFPVSYSYKQKQMHTKKTSKHQFISTSSHKLAFQDYCSNGKPYACSSVKSSSHMFRFPVMWMIIWPPAMHWSWSLNLWWPWLGVRANVSCLVRVKHWGDGTPFSDATMLSLPLGWAKLLTHTWLTLLHRNNGPTLSHRYGPFFNLYCNLVGHKGGFFLHIFWSYYCWSGKIIISKALKIHLCAPLCK